MNPWIFYSDLYSKTGSQSDATLTPPYARLTPKNHYFRTTFTLCKLSR